MTAKIKLCGLSRPADIDYVNQVKPDYCGFIVNFPKSRRNVTPEQVRALTARLSGDIIPVGVFVDESVETVAGLLEDGTIAVAQLHGHEDEAYLAALRKLTAKPIWQAFQIRSAADLERAKSSTANLVLLDSGQGSGVTLDWWILADFPRPFVLAGGLTAENIPAAVQQVKPYAVDLSSGVETEGYKDYEKMLAAVAAVKKE
ncbi:MAG: phosphoribosylanthranilate isomerase [Candidatus Onthomonas sp.]|nr:phosphoribosylanthranilate isomerase [Candidatus Onthomonas sp.]